MMLFAVTIDPSALGKVAKRGFLMKRKIKEKGK